MDLHYFSFIPASSDLFIEPGQATHKKKETQTESMIYYY